MMNTLLMGKRQDSLCHSSGDSDDCLSEDGSRGPYQSAGQTISSSSSINPGRKRRRGIIEKRRRDRINQSLGELKRLVPQALEKSNSAKLEKAEILQMTVEHLKMVGGSRGGSGSGQYGSGTDPYEAHRIAVDYHLVGFKECAAEVARYLTVEGMDIPEQARVKLVTHLQMFASQKECYAAGSRTAYNTTAAAAAAAAAQQHQHQQHAAPTTPPTQQSSGWQAPYTPSSPSSVYTPNCYPNGVDQEGNTSKAMEGGSYFGSGNHYNGGHPVPAAAAPTGGFQQPTPPPPAATLTPSYFSPFTAPTPTAATTAQTSVTSSSAYQYTAPAKAGQQPPYRPWGAEMASC